MAAIFLKQAKADELLRIEKLVINPQNIIRRKNTGITSDILLRSTNRREKFVVSYRQHSINMSKRNHHFRTQRAIGLTRLDLDGPSHRNPDGMEIGSRHLHLYREDYALRWAYDVPTDKFSNLDDFLVTLQEFLRFINVIKLPDIQRDFLL